MARPGDTAGLQFGDDLVGDFGVKTRAVVAGTDSCGVSGHRGSPRQGAGSLSPEPQPVTATRSALSLSIVMLPRCVPSGSSCVRDGRPQRRPAKRGFSAADSPVPAGDARPPRPVPDPPGLHPCPRDGGALCPQTEKGRLCRSEAKASRRSRDRLKRHPQEGQHSAASWRDPGPSASGERHSIARGIVTERPRPGIPFGICGAR
jgi:hypothetical protein